MFRGFHFLLILMIAPLYLVLMGAMDLSIGMHTLCVDVVCSPCVDEPLLCVLPNNCTQRYNIINAMMSVDSNAVCSPGCDDGKQSRLGRGKMFIILGSICIIWLCIVRVFVTVARETQLVPVCSVEDQAECSICLELLDVKKGNVRATPCKHVFHVECIEPWLKVKRCCPNCKDPV
jgi:hypothetical protein